MIDPETCPHPKRVILTATKDRCEACGEIINLSRLQAFARARAGKKILAKSVKKGW